MVKNRVTLTWPAVTHSDSGVAQKTRATRLYVCTLIDSYLKYVAHVVYKIMSVQQWARSFPQ